MKNLISVIVAMLVGVVAMVAQAGHVEVHVAEAGTLAQLLEGKTGITSLTVSGNLNDADIAAIRDVCDNTLVDLVDMTDANCTDNRLPYRAFYHTEIWNPDGKHGPEKVILPKNLKIIGEDAFLGSRIKEIVMWEGLEEIEEDALAETEIQTIEFPTTCTKFGSGALFSTKVNHLKIPEGTSDIPANFAFQCFNLETLELPSTLTSIGDNAFWKSSLKRIHIPEGVTKIGARAFFTGCLEEIILPSTISRLGLWSLAQTYGTVYCKAPFVWSCELRYNSYDAEHGLWAYETPFDLGINTGRYVIPNNPPHAELPNGTLYVPIGCSQSYRDNIAFHMFGTIIETDNFPASLDDITFDFDATTTVTIDGRNITIGIDLAREIAYQVYSLDGRTVAVGTASADVSLELPGAGVYVVRAGAKTVKIAVR